MASKRSELPFERIQLFAPVSAYQGPIFADALAKILSRVKVEIVKRSDQAKGPRDRTSCARFRSCRMLRHPRWSVSWQYRIQSDNASSTAKAAIGFDSVRAPPRCRRRG